MTFDDFQHKAMVTAIYPNKGNNLIYPTLGLADEAGEFVGKVKKLMRDRDNVLDGEYVTLMAKELGDVLWYVAACCEEMQISMSGVADMVLYKLKDRAERGVIQGNGDTR